VDVVKREHLRDFIVNVSVGSEIDIKNSPKVFRELPVVSE